MGRERGGDEWREVHVGWGLVRRNAGCVDHENDRCLSQETECHDYRRTWRKEATRSYT